MPLQIVRQDITKMQVDAIVNTTNEEMVGYSGVDLAVHTLAGAGLDAECAKIAPLGLGEAKITGAYRLPCKYIIHTSGPVWRGGLHGESIILRSCYTEALRLAAEAGCESVAFPLISSGAYGYPKDKVLKFAVQTITEFLFAHELTVYLCVFDRDSYSFSRELFRDILEFMDYGCAEARRMPHLEKCEKEEKASVLRKAKASYSARPKRAANIHAEEQSLYEYLKQMDKGFQEMLFDLIDKSGMTDVECYKKANVDKRIFSKIKSNKAYRPSKQTAVAFAIALRLDLDETQALLATVGLTLSRSNLFDNIIRYFIHNKNYNIAEINEALFEFDQVLLGSF